jgi:hypothetical protein
LLKRMQLVLLQLGSDGREYPFIAKGSEDLRQDDRIERLFRAMDALLAAAPAARARGLHVRTFHVAPLSIRCGLLEFVGGTTPVLDALNARTKEGNAVVEKHQGWIKAQATAKDSSGSGGGGGSAGAAAAAAAARAAVTASASGGMLRRRVLPATGSAALGSSAGPVSADHFLMAMARTPHGDGERALSSLSRRAAAAGAAATQASDSTTMTTQSRRAGCGPPPPALRTALMTAAGSPDAFIAMRRRYAASLAASSVCGWVAGVGDRHLQNILIDLRDGSLVHIDFGYAFGTATAVLPIPELVPFRATGALLGALAPMDARAALSGDMAAAMHALRRGAALLRGVMDVFLREPLIDWQREARQVQVKAGKAVKGGGGGAGTAGDPVTDAAGGTAAAAAAAAAVVEGTSGLGGDEGRFVVGLYKLNPFDP